MEKPNGSTWFVSRFPASNVQGGAEGRNGASWARSQGLPSTLGWKSPRISCMWLDFLHHLPSCCLWFFVLPPELLPPWSLFTSAVTCYLCVTCPFLLGIVPFPFPSALSKAWFVLGFVSRRGFRETPKDFSPGGRRWMLSLPNAWHLSPKYCREAGPSLAGKGTEFLTAGSQPGSSSGMLVWDLAPKQTQQHLGHGLSWS